MRMPRRPKKSLNKRHTTYANSRGYQEENPPTPSELNAEEMTPVTPSSAPEAQLSFFITNAQKAKLRERGYSDDQIAHMKPAEAHKILGLK